ncbi:MAG: helix-turn-helix domain-containing protein [Pseudolabrys sp.]
MTDRRYSIIPARAVADPRLEGRDLQVLCFLGMHTDKLGWCFLGQGMIAEKIGCGRSTVQRSVARLIDAGFVETREFNGARPHACHAYRVIMDLDDPQLTPPTDADDDDSDGSRCPQGGHLTRRCITSGHRCPA